MPTIVQFRRGTEAQSDAFTGNVGELSVDTTNETVRVHDGSTAGGSRLATYAEVADRMQVANVESLVTTSINNVLDSAPGTLDTLNELAAAIGDDADFLSKVQANIDQKLGATASVTLSGDVTGTASFSSNAVSITTTIADDSHNHVISNVDGLQNELDSKIEVANAIATFSTLTQLGNTNSYIAGVQSNLNATNANVDQKLGATASVTTGAVTGTANFSANAVSITTTATADPTITLGGDLTGSVTLTNLGDGTLTATVVDDSHNHIISNVDGLQAALDAKASLAGAAFTGAITTTSTFDGRDVATDGSKLDGIETNATADQTASEILTAVKTVDGAASGLDADLLDGQHGSHYLDWTNTTNKPDPTITLGGDLTGSITLTDLAGGTLTAAVVDDSHNHSSSSGAFTVGTDLTVSGGDIILSGTGRIQGVDTVSAGTDAANKTYVDTAVANIVDTAPEALNTLNELAAALGDDANFATTTATSLGTKAANTYVNSTFQTIITGGATTITSSDLTVSRALVSDGSGKVAVSAVTSTEIGYLDGVTSAIQTQLNGKQATITGAATTIDTENLTVSRALVSDGSGKVAVSAVTSTEIGYLDGVTSAIQTQLNAKQASGSYVVTTNNLSDLTNFATARTNLGLGSLATLSTVNAATITDNSVGAAELNVVRQWNNSAVPTL
jgi:hypothetical protein